MGASESVQSVEPGYIRSLTAMEEYATRPRLSNRPWHTTIYVAHISGPVVSVTRERLIQALVNTANRYLYLRAMTHVKDKYISEVTDPRILRNLIASAVNIRATNEEWKRIVHEELTEFCPGIQGDTICLPWKLIFLRGTKPNTATVIHSVDHLIADGRSSQLFFTEFLSNLSQKTPTVPPHLFDEKPSSQDRCIDSASKFKSVITLAKAIYNDYYSTNVPQDMRMVPIRDRHYSLEYVTLTSQETSNLIAKAKAQGVTVTSMLASLVLIASKANIHEKELSSLYTIYLAIDLRPHYKPLVTEKEGTSFKELFGNHINARMGYYSVTEDTDAISLAQLYDQDTRYYIESGQMIQDGLHFEQWVPSVESLAENKKNGRVGLIFYSNLGTWQSGEDFGQFKIEEFYFTGPNNLMGSSILFNVQTVNGRMNFTFTFIDEIINEAYRQSFLKHFMQSVKEL